MKFFIDSTFFFNSIERLLQILSLVKARKIIDEVVIVYQNYVCQGGRMMSLSVAQKTKLDSPHFIGNTDISPASNSTLGIN